MPAPPYPVEQYAAALVLTAPADLATDPAFLPPYGQRGLQLSAAPIVEVAAVAAIVEAELACRPEAY